MRSLPPTPPCRSPFAGLCRVATDFDGLSRKFLVHDERGRLLFEVRALEEAMTAAALALFAQLAVSEAVAPKRTPVEARVLAFRPRRST